MWFSYLKDLGGASRGIFRGASLDTFSGGPVKKNTLYVLPSLNSHHSWIVVFNEYYSCTPHLFVILATKLTMCQSCEGLKGPLSPLCLLEIVVNSCCCTNVYSEKCDCTRNARDQIHKYMLIRMEQSLKGSLSTFVCLKLLSIHVVVQTFIQKSVIVTEIQKIKTTNIHVC